MTPGNDVFLCFDVPCVRCFHGVVQRRVHAAVVVIRPNPNVAQLQGGCTILMLREREREREKSFVLLRRTPVSKQTFLPPASLLSLCKSSARPLALDPRVLKKPLLYSTLLT